MITSEGALDHDLWVGRHQIRSDSGTSLISLAVTQGDGCCASIHLSSPGQQEATFLVVEKPQRPTKFDRHRCYQMIEWNCQETSLRCPVAAFITGHGIQSCNTHSHGEGAAARGGHRGRGDRRARDGGGAEEGGAAEPRAGEVPRAPRRRSCVNAVPQRLARPRSSRRCPQAHPLVPRHRKVRLVFVFFSVLFFASSVCYNAQSMYDDSCCFFQIAHHRPLKWNYKRGAL